MNIRLLQEAADDVRQQADYYQTVASAQLSQRWKKAVRLTMRSLAVMPMRAATLPVVEKKWRNVRRIAVEGFANYSIYYELDDSSSTLFILRVLHSARELTPLAAADEPDSVEQS